MGPGVHCFRSPHDEKLVEGLPEAVLGIRVRIEARALHMALQFPSLLLGFQVLQHQSRVWESQS
jgi:hypothetical protein